jgi:hypothetical protein
MIRYRTVRKNYIGIPVQQTGISHGVLGIDPKELSSDQPSEEYDVLALVLIVLRFKRRV